MSQLNVTNLLDTAFILLITFMLVAPQLSHGIKLEIPEVKDAPVLSPPTEKTVILIIRKAEQGEQETLYIKDTSREKRVEVSEIRDLLAGLLAPSKVVNVVIEVDKDSRSGVFVEVINEVQQAGIENIGIRARLAETN
jgi:biopolymer transport protein ExbD